MSDTTVLTTIEAPAGAPEIPDGGAEPHEPAPAASGAPGGEGTEAPKPAEPDPRLEIAKKLDQASRREARARQRETQLQERETRAETKERQAEERAAKLQAEQDEFMADPAGYLLKHGKDPVEAVRRFTKPQTDVERQLAALQAEREAEKKAALEREETYKTTAAERAQQEQIVRFVRDISPDEFPHLTTVYPASEVPGLVKSLLSEPAEGGVTLLEAFKEEHGRNPTNKEIQRALESRAATRARGLYEGLKKLFEPSSPPEVAPAPNANSGTTSLSNTHAGKLVSNGAAPKKNREQVMAELRAQLEAETDEA